MELELKNVCSLENAKIEFNGITVIAGENGTGKSTISRSLWSIFFALNNLNVKRKKFIRNEILSAFKGINLNGIDNEVKEKIFNDLIDCQSEINKSFDSDKKIDNKSMRNRINDIISIEKNNMLGLDNVERYNALLNQLVAILTKNNNEYNCKILNPILRNEFEEKINNVTNKNAISSIILKFTKNDDCTYKYNYIIDIINSFVNKITIPKQKLENGKEIEHEILHSVYYYDSLNVDYNYIIHDHTHLNWEANNHKDCFDKEIVFLPESLYKTYLYDKKMLSVIKKCFIDFGEQGDVFSNEEEKKTYYREKMFNDNISTKLIAQGLKNILVIKQFFMNKSVEFLKDEIMIFDEPETNLHPKWQIAFAKTICLLRKELNLTMLVNTHSPYFIDALEHYANEERLINDCKFYLASNENGKNKIDDATNNIDIIYKNLYEPFLNIKDDRNNE